ncbi:hypothetical protein [Staphylococcus pettenkoferi]|uniref:hypothetical protein n=1 Tax=Staphylococcus pettenkoferi TaxID=170573 RepID=UPI00066CED3C|nr:hypothetical protein [Staphylococcus pettenkoferi]MCY1567321.1 hypothetical protein [Staphylococcus pettenkoferi]MCY1588335.1 hypothetical protein [Staphylococcus pettenkoferi]MDK7114765.1 hypothetical protein [Staphylococcus pettenkoferi]MDK7283565.1 hypothetical protein [Staphylococcus pettenkoferi]
MSNQLLTTNRLIRRLYQLEELSDYINKILDEQITHRNFNEIDHITDVARWHIVLILSKLYRNQARYGKKVDDYKLEMYTDREIFEKVIVSPELEELESLDLTARLEEWYYEVALKDVLNLVKTFPYLGLNIDGEEPEVYERYRQNEIKVLQMFFEKNPWILCQFSSQYFRKNKLMKLIDSAFIAAHQQYYFQGIAGEIAQELIRRCRVGHPSSGC